MKKFTQKGLVLASAAAALLATGYIAEQAKAYEHLVKCSGGNACRAASNSCPTGSGNSCPNPQGYIWLTKEECRRAGGSIIGD